MEHERDKPLPGNGERKPDSISGALALIGEVVKSVADGDFTQRAHVHFPESHPMAALAEGVNSMIEALGVAREEAEAHFTHLEEQIATIEAQRNAIRELSTPVIEIWKGVLCTPIVGVLDSMRASDITAELLHAVVERRAVYVILDITGIEVMDTSTTDHFLRLAKSVTLLGAKCVLSGVTPRVASTITQMGVELDGVRSHRNLRDALRAWVAGGGRRGLQRKRIDT